MSTNNDNHPVTLLAGGVERLRRSDIDVEEYIINEVCDRPHLYDSERPDYRDGVKRANSFATIGREIKMSGDEVSRRWKSLRDKFSKEKRLIEARLGSSSPNNVACNKWKYYKSLQFLSEHLRPRKPSSNLSEVNNSKEVIPKEERDDDNHTISQLGDTAESLNLGFGDASTDIETPVSPAAIPSPSPTRDQPMEHRTPLSTRSSSTSPERNGPPPKRHRGGSTSSELINAMRYIGEALQRMYTESVVPSAEDAFGQYVALTLKRFPPYQRALTIGKIQQVLVQSEFGEGEP